MWRENRQSILIAGIPSQRMQRGDTTHIEHDDHMARCDFDQTGEISAIHTPQDAFRRVHEMIHANHSYPDRIKREYGNILDTVWNITEDCFMHQSHWPWRRGETPNDILKSARKFMRDEMKETGRA